MAAYRLSAVNPADLLACLQREILRADTTHIAHQVAAWRDMTSRSPLLDGMTDDRLLAMSEVRLSFYVDRFPPQFWKRLWARILILSRRPQKNIWLVNPRRSRHAKQVSLTAERNTEGDWEFHVEPELEELRRAYGLTALG
jgi:hypothetical protein